MTDEDDLLAAAREALSNAHAPYSGYRVGAAIETADGTVFTGCNVENANFSNSLHAEEVALSAAVARGHRRFERIAVSSAARDGVTPCGMCRQTLSEFCGADFAVLCDEGETTSRYALGELLPGAISAATLRAAEDRRVEGVSGPGTSGSDDPGAPGTGRGPDGEESDEGDDATDGGDRR